MFLHSRKRETAKHEFSREACKDKTEKKFYFALVMPSRSLKLMSILCRTVHDISLFCLLSFLMVENQASGRERQLTVNIFKGKRLLHDTYIDFHFIYTKFSFCMSTIHIS